MVNSKGCISVLFKANMTLCASLSSCEASPRPHATTPGPTPSAAYIRDVNCPINSHPIQQVKYNCDSVLLRFLDNGWIGICYSMYGHNCVHLQVVHFTVFISAHFHHSQSFFHCRCYVKCSKYLERKLFYCTSKITVAFTKSVT